MEEYLPKINIKFIFFFLSLLISNISCKDIYKDNIYDNTNENQNLQDNKQETPITIETGTVYKINLDRLNSKNIAFIMSQIYRQFDLLIHFYPLECDIYITDELYKGERIYNISNYNYNAFYTLITRSLYTTFDIKSLMNSISMEYQNLMCPLIINSIKIYDNTIPELVVNEKEPILFYFRDEVPKLKLIYNHNNNENPIIVSFFIKEKVKFRIECNDGEEKINKTIYYKETILIKPKSSNTKYNILLTRMDQINSVVIIKVSGNNYSPFYLQNNILNLGFIPKNKICQYYYMKVYKGQEGEILLNNKRLNGMLISKIINKNENDNILNIKIFPECNKNINLSNEFLRFNEYNKKLSFNSSNTNICENNCYLLVTYYSDQHNYLNITGNQYTLLSRNWEEEDFTSQIVNIPLNEFIFGVIDNTTINIHYYSIYIPEDTENITIEMHGENIISYAKKGIKKINPYKITKHTKQLNKNLTEKLIINLNKKELGLDSYKGQYITFAFRKGDDDNQFSYYYFRILQPNNNNIIIYPIDTNKDTLCETKIINESNACYFLLKNEYKELSNKFVFYGFGQEEINYTIYFINNEDYLIDLESLNQKKKIERINGYLKYEGNYEDSMFAVIKIISNYVENISFVSNFYEINKLEQTFDIYSYQLFYLNNYTNIFFYINQNLLHKYRIFINNIGGRGNLILNGFDEKKDNITFEGKKTYSFSSNKETKNIQLFSQRNLAFKIKINYKMKYEFMDELDYQYNKIDISNKVNKGKYPIIYYIKDIKYGGMDINLFFKFKNDNSINNDFIIRGGVIDYKDFKEIEDDNEVEYYLKSSFNGTYEPLMNTGLIVFDKELSEKKERNKKGNDEYSFILIYKRPSSNINDFNLDINVIPKNDNKTFLIKDKYIQSSFNLLNKTSEIQKYYIDKENVGEEKFYLEISSNYENVYIEFNNINNTSEKILGGVKQYCLSISNIEANDHFFTIKVNKSIEIKDPKFRVNINLIYYFEDRKIDIENFINKIDISYNQYDYEADDDKKKINVIIKNIQEKNDSSIAYFYYLRYINKKNLIENEIINTISPIFSNVEYLMTSKDKNQELSYDIICDIEQSYIASLQIKIVDDFENEKYYSIPLHFEANKNFIENNKNVIAIIIFVFVIIIILIVFSLCFIRIKKRNINLEDKFKAISFSSGIDSDSSNISIPEKLKGDDEYENTFI